jgi:hypothetical protein
LAYSQQHLAWLASGGSWQLPPHVKRLRDYLRGLGYTVYDLGNDSHLDHQPPEDHAPYSETGWPGTSPYGYVMALDIMPGGGPWSLQTLGAQFKADRDSGRFPSLKYMNWGPSNDSSAIHSAWQPSYAQWSSSDTGHIHLSFRTDYVNWTGTYLPFGDDVELTDTVPNTATSAAPNGRNVGQILADQQQRRSIDIGELGLTTYPATAPYRKLLETTGKIDVLVATVNAMKITLDAVFTLAQQGSGSFDTASVLAHMDQLAQTELARDNALKQENADLRARLKAAYDTQA